MYTIDYKVLTLTIMLLIYAGLWLLVYLKSKNDALSKTFNIFTTFMCLWTTMLIMFFAIYDTTVSLISIKLVYIFGGLIPPAFVLYSYAYTGKAGQINRIKKFLLYLPSIALIALYFLTNNMIAKVVYIDGIKGWEFGKYHYFWEINFIGIFVFGFYRYVQIYKNSLGLVRNQTKYILLGTMSGVLLASITNVILPFIKIFDYVWLGPTASVIWLLCIVYTIIKFQLKTKISLL